MVNMHNTTTNLKFMVLLLLLLLGITWLALPGVAQGEEIIDVELAIDRHSATVGDPIALNINITHPEGSFVIFPEWEEPWGDFYVREQSPATTIQKQDGALLTNKTLTLSVFTPGIHTTPDTNIKLTDVAGNLNEIPLEPVQIEILSVLVEGDQNLRDIKPQASLPSQSTKLVFFAVGLLIVLVGILAIYFLRRAWQVKALDTRPAHLIAFETLDQIEKLDLPGRGLFKQHYSMLSDTLREYIQSDFDVPMLECTTAEIRRNLKGTLMTRELMQRTLIFLSACDLVKFSKFSPSEVEAADALAEARRLVHLSNQLIQVEAEQDHESSIDDADTKNSSRKHGVVL
jgi:hypothetical protein